MKYMALKSMRSGHFGAIFAAISTGLCRDAALPTIVYIASVCPGDQVSSC